MSFRRPLLALLIASHCFPVSAVPALAQARAQDSLQDRIAPGDVILINVFPGEEYSREVTVQPDGSIQMPLIGALQVRGMSVAELQTALERRYAKFVANPQVTANIKRFTGRRVAIIGEIQKPGYYDFRDGMKLLELVSLAGGLGPDARGSRIVILRSDRNGERSFTVNLKAVLQGDLTRDPLLLPGDTINVPKQPFTQGAAWVQRNVLPWALITSMIASILVASRRR
jgi:polysaccharide biosynthesis/export protein